MERKLEIGVGVAVLIGACALGLWLYNDCGYSVEHAMLFAIAMTGVYAVGIVAFGKTFVTCVAVVGAISLFVGMTLWFTELFSDDRVGFILALLATFAISLIVVVSSGCKLKPKPID